ncbi:ribosome maturation factor RimM [Pelagibacterium lentulum]|uniref:Ribosome maturation factor RimM n=1 Tax=Pelagibacterium lentulum TaxID=2029865 RepID=A0A916VUI2_9HYPH|nr:ribosome maturation factor RimM [Pelagibacterium lentulum]GGA36971.1 ribosome maturation factor RimM [Pelagibacterium lentulum]
MTKTPILLGKIGAAHGIKGEVRITSYTEDPLAIANYGVLDTDRPGLSVKITRARQAKSVLIASLEGITDRNGAEKLNGVSLYIDRARLDEPEEDEFYHTDLIGLEVRQPDETVLGTITAVANFGADDLLDIRLKENGKSVFLPFTKAVVPRVDVRKGFVIAIPPQGWLEDTPRDPEETDPEDTP